MRSRLSASSIGRIIESCQINDRPTSCLIFPLSTLRKMRQFPAFPCLAWQLSLRLIYWVGRDLRGARQRPRNRKDCIDLRAIDLFLSRFAPDPNWSGNLVNSLPGRDDVIGKLKEIEEDLCRQPAGLTMAPTS